MWNVAIKLNSTSLVQGAEQGLGTHEAQYFSPLWQQTPSSNFIRFQVEKRTILGQHKLVSGYILVGKQSDKIVQLRNTLGSISYICIVYDEPEKKKIDSWITQKSRNYASAENYLSS